jgi:hypothetical protein
MIHKIGFKFFRHFISSFIKSIITPSENDPWFLNLGNIECIPCFRRPGRKLIHNRSLDWTSLETLPALLTKVQNDSRLSFVQTDNPRRTSTGTGSTTIASIGIDPRIEPQMA